MSTASAQRFNDASSSSSSSSLSSAHSYSRPRSSGRARRPALNRGQSPATNPYPRGPPITPEEKLFSALSQACIASCPLVAVDDILVPLFNDIRNGLYVRRIGDRLLSPQDSMLLKETFGTAISAQTDPGNAIGQAEIFTARMKAHGIIASDEDEVAAFSNLSLRYARLKQSSLIRISHSIMNGRVEARVIAKAYIPRRVLLLELGGIMAADAIENPVNTEGSVIRKRKRKSSSPAFKMFSVIWKTPNQYGPGPRKDRILLGPTRFINHSCRPNCKLVPHPRTNAWSVETFKDIEEGEELTISYGDHYFGDGECACASCVTAVEEIPSSQTPTTSLASSPSPSPHSVESGTSRKSSNKRRRLNSDTGLDTPMPTKATRR